MADEDHAAPGREVRYGLCVQLRHVISGKVLSISRGHSVGLSPAGSDDARAGSSLVVAPRLRVHSIGSKVDGELQTAHAAKMVTPGASARTLSSAHYVVSVMLEGALLAYFLSRLQVHIGDPVSLEGLSGSRLQSNEHSTMMQPLLFVLRLGLNSTKQRRPTRHKSWPLKLDCELK